MMNTCKRRPGGGGSRFGQPTVGHAGKNCPGTGDLTRSDQARGGQKNHSPGRHGCDCLNCSDLRLLLLLVPLLTLGRAGRAPRWAPAAPW